MKKLIAITIMPLLLGAWSFRPKYQVCALATQSGEIACDDRSTDRQTADQKAMILNLSGGGQLFAWVRKFQKPAGDKAPAVPVFKVLPPTGDAEKM